MLELNAITAIAGRDLLKFFRDPGRLVAAVVFPFLMIFLLGGTLQLNLGQSAGFNFIGFTFTGFLGMTLFQSTAQGLSSLMEDRQNDFAQEVFVSPVSRYSIVFGKIAGETLVAIMQVIPFVLFALLLRVAADAVARRPAGAGGAALMLHGRRFRSAPAEYDVRHQSGKPDLQLRLPAPVLPGWPHQSDQRLALVSRGAVSAVADALRDRPGAGRRLLGDPGIQPRRAVEPGDQHRRPGGDVRCVHGRRHGTVRAARNQSLARPAV